MLLEEKNKQYKDDVIGDKNREIARGIAALAEKNSHMELILSNY
jgi:hypothetical protein